MGMCNPEHIQNVLPLLGLFKYDITPGGGRVGLQKNVRKCEEGVGVGMEK